MYVKNCCPNQRSGTTTNAMGINALVADLFTIVTSPVPTTNAYFHFIMENATIAGYDSQLIF
ncbi:hypothetical protein Ngar_c31290 [Candidatus Nitrososphaera gargensis Ga9.2]|uniref:Uncharacterized protein n=1 Tax=Nitrososphaera gargensis (strain Ga9.2) TaxID=1237085 RepID=K0IJ61_NITGG|nr:hypothetical protein Ngar_c31290 [Candidatus Nitrososphaera gargensis Ga9.2]